MCLSQKNADCIANAISSNHPYDSKYEEDPLLNIPKKYITRCFSGCLGIKGNWSKAFYKEMVDTAPPKSKISNTECYIKYLEKNLDPIHLLDPDFDNKNKDLINDSVKQCNVPRPPLVTTSPPVVTICPLNCQGKNSCGVDGCVGSCGTCPNNNVCSDDGTCTCPSNCQGKSCGVNGCVGSCGTCPNNNVCSDDGTCTCPSNCQGKSCGVDGCVGSCGTCPNNNVCSDDGTCNGWSTDNIEELADVLQNTNYIYDSFTKLCINPDSAKCLATNIASDNYNSYPGSIAAQKDVIKYTPKYLGKCLKHGCAGVKGKWSQSMYNEIADGQICLYNYLESQIDPVEFISDNIYVKYYNSDDPDAKKANQKGTDIARDAIKSCGIE
jgi:hypothetical protein